jgi:hypothetical protein
VGVIWQRTEFNVSDRDDEQVTEVIEKNESVLAAMAPEDIN